MRNAIIDKLKIHIAECPRTEPDIVYALVQIRKLLEQADEKKKYTWLNFMCNWVAHTKLDQGKAADILQILEARLLDLSTLDGDGKAGEVLSFDLFRGEFSRFCKSNDLPTEWEGEYWREVLTLYARVVQDCPVTLKSLDVGKKLQNVVLTATDSSERLIEEPYPGKIVLHLDWLLTLNDGCTHEFGYNLVLSEE